MARHSSLRASDADRDAVADRLRQASVEGRLEPDELEDRLHAAFRARTYGELDRLLTDLPVQWRRRRADVVPAARMAVVVATRVLVVLAIVTVVVVAVALSAAWWLLCAVIWLTLRAGRGSCHGRLGRGSAWQRPPRARRV